MLIKKTRVCILVKPPIKLEATVHPYNGFLLVRFEACSCFFAVLVATCMSYLVFLYMKCFKMHRYLSESIASIMHDSSH